MKEEVPLFTRQFNLLCLSAFLFYASFNMIIPELPGYLTRLGGEEFKGLIIGLFTLTAGLSRPVSGKLADKIGRIPVMVFGALVCFGCGFLYPILSSVAGFLLLRLLHGMSTGFTPTGNSAFAADVVPATRRGEAIGFLGLCSSSGMALGPVIGSAVAEAISMNALFYCSSATAILSVLILAGMKETVTDRQPFRWQLLRFSRSEIFEPRVLSPSLVIVLSSFAFGTVLTLAPDLSESVGLQNKGLFFLCFTFAGLAVRFFAGKLSDTYGRVPVLRVSTALLALSMILVGFAYSPVTLLIAATLFGLAQATNSPTLSAWTVDLSHPAHRGRALATMYVAMEAGIGLGAFLSGTLNGNYTGLLHYTFRLIAIFPAMAFLYLVFGVKKPYPRLPVC